MGKLRALWLRFYGIFTDRRGDREFSAELESHLQMHIDDNLRSGMNLEEARRDALIKLGGVAQAKQAYRERWTLPSLTNLSRDLRFAFRQLRKSPGFTAAAVLTLALGIGANLTVFLILYGVLLKPLPFTHPEQIVRIERLFPNGAESEAYTGTGALFFRRMSRALDSVAAYDYLPSHVNLVENGEAVPLDALRVTSDFFRVFAVSPKQGRGFAPQDMLPNTPGTAVLSDSIWRNQFGANPGILGHSIILGNKPYTVIGVAGPEFRLDSKVDVWIPLTIAEDPEDHSHNYNLVARMKPGVTHSQVDADLRNVLLEFKDAYPKLWHPNESVRVHDYHDSLVGKIRPVLVMLMGAVVVVLLIVSANILSLLLTRSIARRKEMNLRAAIGATAWHILRQLLVENIILCLAGGMIGVLLAEFAIPIMMHISPIQLPHFAFLHFDSSALLFTVGLILLCALTFSLVPAIESRRTQLSDSLRANSLQVVGGNNLAQKSLVVGEVALSLMLLVAAFLLLTSFWNLLHSPSGFSAQNVLTFRTGFTDEQAASSAAYGQRLNELVTRLESLPGVESAAAVDSLPTQVVPDLPFDILGRPAGQPNSSGDEKYMPITGHYFEALHIPILAGRALTQSDAHSSAPVLVVNQQFARTYFKNQNPVGQHILIGAAMGPGFEDNIREIVGVAGDVKQEGLDKPVPGIMYLPYTQIPDKQTLMINSFVGASWVVRMKSASIDVATPARAIFMDNARTPLLSVESMGNVVNASVAQERFTMLLLSTFGLISLFLGGAGLYGVMSYTVTRQTKEIGVRMAIGAQRGDILRMVLGMAGRLVGMGLIVGIAASLAGTQLIRTLLFGIAPHNLFTLAVACGVLLMTGLFAAWLPARRAASVNPMQALRTE